MNRCGSLVLISLLKFAFASENYFCDLRCYTNNAPCYRQPCSPSYACGANFSMFNLTDEARNAILRINNDFRHAIAEGIYHQLMPATNMYRLSYDEELEFIAQCWANNCKPLHDTCVTTEKFKYVAQNVAKFAIKPNVVVEEIILNAFNKYWLPEIAKLTRSVVKDNVFIRLPSTRSVLNIMCAKTTHIGCAVVKFSHGVVLNALVVCNYGPYDCTITDLLYDEGDTDTECKYGVYKNGLCIPQRKVLARRHWKAPFRIKQTAASWKLQLDRILLVISAIVIIVLNGV